MDQLPLDCTFTAKVTLRFLGRELFSYFYLLDARAREK